MYKVMKQPIPKVSVLMSVYNGSQYLRESIESILNQTFTDFEFIIINDCSTDNTWEILNEYAIQDQRLVLISNPENLGLTKSLNKGLQVAKGEYIARQDADDISLPQRLETQASLLNKHSDIALVSCNIEIINSEGCPIEKYHRSCESDLVGWYLLFYNHLGGHSQVIFRRDIVMNLGGYCENYRYAQDYELWCRIVKVGKIVILPEFLLQQRRHNQSISLVKALEQDAYALAQVKHNISQLIGKEISIEEAKYLREFCFGHWKPRSALARRKVRVINAKIKEISQAFVQESSFHHDMSRRLRRWIGEQFVSWTKSLSTQYSLMAKILVFLYALIWNPIGGIKYLITSIITFPRRRLFNLTI
jgi:glycosyltransferase involved in cell wall biosynthesis